tara:strand:- start:1202 stop:1945 length:744 start_codon:yes stop_codon:yes gene_type:complete
MIILPILFFVTAILYSSVGFGGGSTYLALLLLWDIPYYILPVIALGCNIVVVSGNSFNYIKAGNLNHRLLTPYLIGSVPMAYLGGTLEIEKNIFEILLFFVLLISGILLLFNFKSYDDNTNKYKEINYFFSLSIGAVLGILSGIVGIGGGIFLSPILFLLRAGLPKHIVTTSSLFILINSLAGIFGQLTKSYVLNDVLEYWYLLLFVFIGGQIGNYLNLKILPTRFLALITSCLVIFVAIRMALRIL